MYNLRMLVICPKCQAENEDVARFCNQCGAPLGNTLPENRPVVTEEPETGAQRKAGVVNWSGLVIIALVIGAIWYVVGSHPTATSGADAGGPMMPQEVLDKIGGLKETLRQNPADIDALRGLYETYGMVGKISEVTPYSEAALDYLKQNKSSLSPEELGDAFLGLFIACYENRDDAICLTVLEEYHAQFPDNMRILKVLGDLCYDNMMFDKAIQYYSEFLEKSTMADDEESYLNAMTDLGTCYIQEAAGDTVDTELMEKALATFDEVLGYKADFWQAHFNRGIALAKLERNDEAVAEYSWCADNTEDAMDKWRAGTARAEITGEDPPAMPANPHGEGFDGTGNPHGEAMANPHGEGTAPPLDGNNLPPNPHSEDFLKQNSGASGDG